LLLLLFLPPLKAWLRLLLSPAPLLLPLLPAPHCQASLLVLAWPLLPLLQRLLLLLLLLV
jgi:hypothetical protein